jgi:carbon storage regulator
MLVLSRKLNEQIIIGDNIRVTVVSIRGNQVRLGFEAPPEVLIFRDELCTEHAPHESGSGPVGLEEAADRSSLLLANGHE